MTSLLRAVLSLIMAVLEWLGSPSGSTPPTGGGPAASQSHATSASSSAIPFAAGSEQTASVFALLRAIDPCGLHDPAAAARVTGDHAEAILPGESLSVCQLRMRTRPHEPSWTFTTTVGSAFSAADRLAAVPEEIDGRTFYRTEIVSPHRSCGYTRPMGAEFGIGLTVDAPIGEPAAQPCRIAKAYLLAAQPLTRLVLRAQHRTEPRLPLASLDPCQPTTAILHGLAVSGTAEPVAPYECRVHPDPPTATGSAVSIQFGFRTDPAELATAGGSHHPVTVAGRAGVATSASDGACELVLPYDIGNAVRIDQTRWLQTVTVHTNSCEHATTIAESVMAAIARR